MKKRYHKSGQPQQGHDARKEPRREHREGRPERSERRDQRPKRDGKPDFKKPDFKKPDFKKRDFKAAAPATPKLVGPLLWGLHPVRAAWLNPKRQVLRLLVTDTGLESLKATIAEAQDAGIKRVKPEVLDKEIFARMLPASAVHQGVAVLVEPLEPRDAHDLIANLKPGQKATLVILDQVTDPHNVGAILRSASAFGCAGVVMQERHAPELSGVLAKSASGAVDAVPVAVETNLSRAIEMLQENGFVVIGLDERGSAISAQPKHDRLAIVLGAEGEGLRRLVAEHCDALVALPTQGPILSLNVSNAAAVALYALTAG